MAVDISIVVLTYYHEKYIRQSLDSILSQETDYSYEVIVSDDCSKDRTIEIIKEYCETYPEVFKPTFNETNMGIPANLYRACCKCSGKYITFLAGDDYWINDGKLQFQANFLEKNQEYYGVICCSETRYDDETTADSVHPAKKCRDREITYRDFINGTPFPTRGLMFRNEYNTEDGREYYSHIQKASRFVDDTTNTILLLNRGRFYITSVITDVYRVHRTTVGQMNYNSLYGGIRHSEHMISLYNYVYNNPYFHGDLYDKYLLHLGNCFALQLDSDTKKAINQLIDTIPREYLDRGLVHSAKIKGVRIKIRRYLIRAGKAIKLDKVKRLITGQAH